MAPTYATTQDLAAEPWSVTPANAPRLLAAASRLVRRATRAAVYDVDEHGAPTAADVVAAMRDAVCAQVVAWTTIGVDPAAGAVQLGERLVASKSLGSGSIAYDNGAASSVTAMEARAAAATRLAPDAAAILADAGLLGGAVRTSR